jgi:hypothetical protein
MFADWPQDFEPDLAYVRELLHFYNDLVIHSLGKDDIASAELYLAVLEMIRSQLDLYTRMLQK